MQMEGNIFFFFSLMLKRNLTIFQSSSWNPKHNMKDYVCFLRLLESSVPKCDIYNQK